MTKRDLIEAFLIANLLGSVIFAVLTGLVSGVVLIFRKRIGAWIVKRFAPPAIPPSAAAVMITEALCQPDAEETYPLALAALRALDFEGVVSICYPKHPPDWKKATARDVARIVLSDAGRSPPPSPPPPPG